MNVVKLRFSLIFHLLTVVLEEVQSQQRVLLKPALACYACVRGPQFVDLQCHGIKSAFLVRLFPVECWLHSVVRQEFI